MIADAPPFAGPAIILALTVPVLLALLPAYPRSKIILLLWTAGLILAVVISIWAAFFSSPLLWEVLWEIPAWHRPIFLICYVAIPFLTSFLLWQARKNPSRLSATTTTIIMVMVCVVSWFAVTTFNRTCVFYDVFHDGDARGWCPESWQVQPIFGPDGGRLE